MTDLAELAETVRSQVGAIFRNTRRDSESTCDVCVGPASSDLCSKCRWHRNTFGSRLADLVVPLSYAMNGHQSGHHMYGYKGDRAGSAENRRDVKLLMFGAMGWHRECIDAVVGEPWSAVTFVPSASKPGLTHPVKEIAQQVTAWENGANRVLLDLGPRIGAPRGDGPLPDRFAVAEKWRSAVEGQHVLVIDDTWVSGVKSQSAAITLKDAGAAEVTIVCVARWLDRERDGHAELIEQTARGLYDVQECPVARGTCPRRP